MLADHMISLHVGIASKLMTYPLLIFLATFISQSQKLIFYLTELFIELVA